MSHGDDVQCDVSIHIVDVCTDSLHTGARKEIPCCTKLKQKM